MTKQKRIMFLHTTRYFPGGTSGGEVKLLKLIEEIRREYDVWGITSKSGYDILKAIMNKRRILVMRSVDRFPVYLSYILRIFYASFLSIFFIRTDIIFGSSDFLNDVLPSFVYKTKNKKCKWCQCIYHIYPSWHKRAGNKIVNLLAKLSQNISFLLIRRKADVILVLNQDTKCQLIKRGFDKNKIFITSGGIDFKFIKSIKPSEEHYDCVFLSRLNPSKGIFDLIQIMQKVTQKDKNTTLAIIGQSEDNIRKEMLRLIKKAGLTNRVFLKGSLSSHEAYSIIKSSKVFLFPSHEEGFGIVIAEAMACKLPVVSWNLRVYDEVFPERVIKVKENNISNFSAEALKLLKDQGRRKILGEQGYRFVKRYDWQFIVEREKGIINMGIKR